MEADTRQTPLRDTISDAYDSIMPVEDGGAVTDAPAASPVATVSDAAPGTPADDRPRRDDGTFARKPKDSAAAPAAAAQTKAPSASATPSGAAVAPADIPMPKSWKKELEPHWITIPPDARAAIVKRDADYAKGVETYKGEWDRAKPLLDALAPFMPELEQHHLAPEQFITRLASAHRTLALGSPEQKLATFTQLAQQYNIPLSGMFERGADGQVYLRQQQAAQQAQGVTPEQIMQIVEQRLMEKSTTQEIKNFQQAKDDGGNPRYPYFETVKDTMAGLLQAGLAEDLASAYATAIRHPRYGEIFEEQQRLQREATDKAAATERANQAARAKRNAVSTGSATPTATAAAANGKKGLRATIEEAFVEHTAGRV